MLLAFSMSTVVALATARHRSARATARLNSAAERLDSLTEGRPADNSRRAAIAWGYAERLRLGLESPFRLIEAAARDVRLTTDERRTVSWALLSRVLRGETHDVDAAALDALGPSLDGRSASGEQHLDLIERIILPAENPRAAELAVRFVYTLAAAERIVDASAPVLAAEVAAMVADREIARREAAQVVRAANGTDPIDVVRRRRARRSFYIERPTLLSPSDDIEQNAVAMVRPMLQALRVMIPAPRQDSIHALDNNAATLAPRLYAAGAQAIPAAPLTVTVQRYMSLVRAQARRVDDDALARTRNAEMLVAVTRLHHAARVERRAIGRMLLAAAVSMRSLAQERVWGGDATDDAPTAGQIVSAHALASITFDRDVPSAWRPYFLRTFADGITDLRRVLPEIQLEALHVRFRMDSPADSALAMHDPRTRTLHLPVYSAAGTLTHELAHDLDRQSALQDALVGYRSDIVARVGAKAVGRNASANDRFAASLRALTEELSELPNPRVSAERPAEIFATRVDWLVASSLAREGISSGFLSAVQDELLTGHVVHPHRLRSSGRSRSLLTALEGMTTVAPFVAHDEEPSAQTLLRWSLAGPVDRRVAGDIVRAEALAWAPPRLMAVGSCAHGSTRVSLIRMAAESRARGWLRLRARWTSDTARSAWARSVLRQIPWAEDVAEQRVAQLSDYILVELSSAGQLPTGLGGYAAPLAAQARCGAL
jgi:hypothetical protein